MRKLHRLRSPWLGDRIPSYWARTAIGNLSRSTTDEDGAIGVEGLDGGGDANSLVGKRLPDRVLERFGFPQELEPQPCNC